MIASSGAQLLQDDAVETLIGRLFPLATVVTPNLPEAEALTGLVAARRAVSWRSGSSSSEPPPRSSPAGTGSTAVDHLFDGHEHLEIPVERYDVAATHGAGCTHSATLAALLACGLSLPDAARRSGGAASRRSGTASSRSAPAKALSTSSTERSRMTIDPGATLGVIRERKPLVHNITNYVVMNETANAILALGALPVMAHAREEVAEMVGLAGALVLNIGTLSEAWVDAMLLAGEAANERGVPVVLDPVGVGATTYRTETARRLLDEVDVAVLRGNAGEVATLVGVEAEVRGVESVGAGGDSAELAREAARALGVVASVTGAGRPRLGRRALGRSLERSRAARRRSPARAACRPRSRAASSPPRTIRSRPLSRRCRLRRRGRGRRRGREGPGQLPRRPLRRARRARPGDADRASEGRAAEGCVYQSQATAIARAAVQRALCLSDTSSREAARPRRRRGDARRAAAGGATVVQLRLKGSPTAEVVALGRTLAGLDAELIVNDDVDAALELGCGVHLGQGDAGIERADAAGIPLGIRSTTRREGPSPSRAARHTSARGRSGRRRRSRTLRRRSGSTGSATSASRSPSRWSRSAGSTRRTLPSASARAQPASP